MTTPVLDETATIRDLLFGEEPGKPVDQLAQALQDNSTLRAVLASLPAPTAVVAQELATATDRLLSLNLADIAAGGWKKYQALTEAARSTRDRPNARKSVTLVTHLIESSHRPKVELLVNDVSMTLIEIGLQLTFTMAGVRAIVEQGRLTKIESGSCTVAGSIAIQQVELTKKEREFDVPGVVRLGNGLELLGATAGRAMSDPVLHRTFSDA